MSLEEKQKEALIESRGLAIMNVDFYVFEGNKVSMWTHFNHGDDFNETKKRLIAIREHLDNFLKDGAMCPFAPN